MMQRRDLPTLRRQDWAAGAARRRRRAIVHEEPALPLGVAISQIDDLCVGERDGEIAAIGVADDDGAPPGLGETVEIVGEIVERSERQWRDGGRAVER